MIARRRDAPSLFADFFRFDRASRTMAARIDEEGYDLVFASIGGYTEAVLRHLKTPAAYCCHGPMRQVYKSRIPRPYPRNLAVASMRRVWRRLYYGAIMRRWDEQGTCRASLVLASSHCTAGYVKRVYGVSSVVNYAGVDPDAPTPGEEPRERFVLSVGAMMARKGFDWAVRAVGALPAWDRSLLVVVSNNIEAAERRYVENVATEQGVALDIRERISDDELKHVYRTAGAFLYTPHLEPLGLAALKAMACGTPVVAVREVGLVEAVTDGVTGFVCERDADALAAALARVLADPPLARQMGAAARDDVLKRWTCDRFAEELAGLLADQVEFVERGDAVGESSSA